MWYGRTAHNIRYTQCALNVIKYKHKTIDCIMTSDRKETIKNNIIAIIGFLILSFIIGLAGDIEQILCFYISNIFGIVFIIIKSSNALLTLLCFLLNFVLFIITSIIEGFIFSDAGVFYIVQITIFNNVLSFIYSKIVILFYDEFRKSRK
ncbi:hypothetical protein AGMMS49944_17700 [Spirochaetia bacterium]|nr:hypothetical protein AGMMS49944_17700 [Spirochaetia bacterium]